MSKLLNMCEWFTLDKSASYLSNILGEQVLITDLYRLALDNNLTLSVCFLEPVPALIGKLVDEQDFFTQTSNQSTADNSYDLSELSDFSDSFIPIDTLDSSEPVDDDKWFIYEDIAQNINGLWDLTMLGLEYFDLEKLYLDELGVCGYKPQRHKKEGIFVRNDASVCKLLTKLDPSPLYKDNAFVGEVVKDFFEREAIYYDECINHDFDTLTSLLNVSQLDHVTTIINAMSVSFPTYTLYKNCLTIEYYPHQIVIKSQELDRLVQTLGSAPKVGEPPVQKSCVKNNYKHTYNKAMTQTKYSKWQRQAEKLKKLNPYKSKTWIAVQLSKLPIAEGNSPETIRKNIKI